MNVDNMTEKDLREEAAAINRRLALGDASAKDAVRLTRIRHALMVIRGTKTWYAKKQGLSRG